MSIKFHKFSPYRDIPYDLSKLDLTINSLIRNKDTSMILLSLSKEEIPNGMLAIQVSGLPFSNELVAAEVAWWMEPEERSSRQALQMFKAAEYWAKKVGAKFIQFSSLSHSDENVDKFYLRQGYTMTEKAFLKELI